jgi:chromosome segregation ATPase
MINSITIYPKGNDLSTGTVIEDGNPRKMLEGELTMLRNALGVDTAELESLETAKAQAEAQASQAQAMLATKQQEMVDAVEAKRATLNQKHREEIEQVRAEAKAKVDAAEAEVSTCKQQAKSMLDAQKATIAGLQGKIQQGMQAIAFKDQRIAELEQRIQELENQD